MTRDDATIAAIIGPLVLLLAWLIFIVGAQARVQNRCLAAGYPDASVTYTFQGYCSIRINQTDHVVPVEYAVEHPR